MSSSPIRALFLGVWLLLGLSAGSVLAEVREIATVVTSAGTMEFQLYSDSSQTAVANFKYLADSHFYDGTQFHRLINNFMAQGGDPNTLTEETVSNIYGTGGPEYRISNDPVDQARFPDRTHSWGVLSMANSGGTATTGSQFFIMFGSASDLDTKHAQLGRLVSGTSVLNSLNDPTRELVAPPADVVEFLRQAHELARLQDSRFGAFEVPIIHPKIPITINSIRIRSEVASGTLSAVYPAVTDEGLLRDGSRNILGKYKATLSTRGTLSGQLQCYNRTLSFSGRLLPVAGSSTESECVAHLDTKAATPIRVRIRVRRTSATGGSMSVVVNKLDGTDTTLSNRTENAASALMAARDLAGPVLGEQYTLSMNVPSVASGTLGGCGYMTFKYLAKSRLCIAQGRLADGVAVVASFSPSTEGGRDVLPVFSQRFLAGVPSFRFRGSMQVVQNQASSGSFQWYRAAQTEPVVTGSFDMALGAVIS
ncbi:MAG: peptidylprolyl isomerase, partial [Verrucomicrobiota bacterium]